MNARDEAFRQLSEAALPGWRLIAPKPGKVESRDIDLAHAITRSVTKNFGLLRHLVAHYAGRPLRQIDDRAQAVLAIALAQLRFFDRVPPYAVVDEAVEQAKRLKLSKASGFINAVLRRRFASPMRRCRRARMRKNLPKSFSRTRRNCFASCRNCSAKRTR